MKFFKLVTVFIIFLPLLTGCSVYMATQQPEKKDMHVLDRGTPRGHVIAELGRPYHTKIEDGKTCDVFAFVQGYSKGAKTGRAVFHGAADILTLGLWEVVGTPVEAVADGEEVKCEVFYDESERVDYINVIKGNNELKRVNSKAKITSDTSIKQTDIDSKLERLKKLKEDGLITQEDYDKKKAYQQE